MSGTLDLIKNKNSSKNTNLSFYNSKNLPKNHNHIFFKFNKFTIILNDPRRFGFVKLLKGKENLNTYFIIILINNHYNKIFKIIFVYNFLKIIFF